MFFQPELERAIDIHACAPGGREGRARMGGRRRSSRRRGRRAQLRRFAEEEPGRLAPTGETRTVQRAVGRRRGRRQLVRARGERDSRRDLGFQERWLVVDVEPHDMARSRICRSRANGATPRVRRRIVQSGPRHRRWEFMLLPDEQASDFEDPSGCGRCSSRGTGRRTGRYAQRRLRVSLDAGRPDALRACVAGGGCGPPDPAVPWSGAVLGPTGRRQPGLEARPRATRPGAGAATRHDRAPSANRRTRRSSAWRSSSERCYASSTRRRPPNATRCCARSRRRRRSRCRRSAAAYSTTRSLMTQTRSPAP